MESWLFVLGGICLFFGEAAFFGCLLLTDIPEFTDRFVVSEDWIKRSIGYIDFRFLCGCFMCCFSTLRSIGRSTLRPYFVRVYAFFRLFVVAGYSGIYGSLRCFRGLDKIGVLGLVDRTQHAASLHCGSVCFL